MRFLAISDLHVCDGGKSSEFGWKDKAFIKRVKHAFDEQDIHQLVLVGDILELYKYDADNIFRTHERLFDFFDECNAVFVRGNHDLGHTDYPLAHEIRSGDRTVYFEHGHKVDLLCKNRANKVINTNLFRFLERMSKYSDFWLRVYFALQKRREAHFERPSKNTIRYLKYALGLLETHDTVIMGHTHRVGAHKIYYKGKAKLYLNCGTCSKGRFQGVVFDTDGTDYTLIREK